MLPTEHKDRAYFDIIEGIRREYNLDQNVLCRILKINKRIYFNWKKAEKVLSFDPVIQPGINILQLASLHNKLSSFFETTQGAIEWLNDESNVAFEGKSPLSILENSPNGLYLVNNYLAHRMNL